MSDVLLNAFVTGLPHYSFKFLLKFEELGYRLSLLFQVVVGLFVHESKSEYMLTLSVFSLPEKGLGISAFRWFGNCLKFGCLHPLQGQTVITIYIFFCFFSWVKVKPHCLSSAIYAISVRRRYSP